MELKTPAGFAYMQYTHDDPTLGELMRVLPGVYEARRDQPAVASLVAECTAFHTFVYLEDGLSQPRLARVISTRPIPSHAKQFPIFRTGLPNNRDGRVDDWALWDGKRQWGIGALTAEQRKLPVRKLWLLEELALKIAEGYRPEYDLITRYDDSYEDT